VQIFKSFWTSDDTWPDEFQYIDDEPDVGVSFPVLLHPFSVDFNQISFDMIFEIWFAVPLEEAKKDFGWIWFKFFHASAPDDFQIQGNLWDCLPKFVSGLSRIFHCFFPKRSDLKIPSRTAGAILCALARE
jgi:hypothetical protein